MDGFTPFLLQSMNIEASGITTARKSHQTGLGQLLTLNEQYNHEPYAFDRNYSWVLTISLVPSLEILGYGAQAWLADRKPSYKPSKAMSLNFICDSILSRSWKPLNAYEKYC